MADDKPTEDTQHENDFWKPVEDYIKTLDVAEQAHTSDEVLRLVVGNVRAAVTKFAKPIADELRNALAANDQLAATVSRNAVELNKLDMELNALAGENASLRAMIKPTITMTLEELDVSKTSPDAGTRDPQCVGRHRPNCDCTGVARGPIH